MCPMTRQQLLKKLDALPPAAKKKVEQLVNSLAKPRAVKSRTKAKLTKSWTDEPAFGMWKDRQDMDDGAEWVRNFRRQHWDRQRG